MFADVGADVPETPWDEEEAKVVARWRRVPEGQRARLMKVMDTFAK